MMRRVLTVAVAVSCVIGALGFPLIISVTFLTNSNNDKYLKITGGSMEPAIAKGAVINLDPHTVPTQGSVITFMKDGEITTHRVVQHWFSTDPAGKQHQMFSTKGDANSVNDPWIVTDSEVLGVVTTTPLHVRLALPLIENPLISAVLMLPLLLTIIAFELRDMLRTLHILHRRKPLALA
jgi:signal peptidase I